MSALRHWIAGSILSLAALALQATESSPQPNVLFIFTDDQSSRTVGAYSEAYPWVKTPNIDRLATQGVRFSNAYIGSWCMPSRATMLTGKHQYGIESMRMEGPYPGSRYDPEQCPFWPSVFRQNGYYTAHIGKWHTGTDTGFGRDWDHQIVWNRPGHPDNAPNYYSDQLISVDGEPPSVVDGYSTDNYTDWTLKFLEERKNQTSQPWYLWLCYGAVHGPFTPAERHQDSYEEIQVPAPLDIYPPRPGKPSYANQMNFWEANQNRTPVERKVRSASERPVAMKDIPGRPLKDWVRQYHQAVQAIDEGVGRILAALEETGQAKNTLVVFTSDQGFAWGQHGFKSKVAPYKATVGAPLIIRPPNWKLSPTKGTLVAHPVSGVDLPVTFFSYADIPLPWAMHGRDLSPLINQASSSWPHPAMLVHTGKLYGSATEMIPKHDDPRLYHGPGVPWYVMIAQDRFKYVRTLVEGEIEELYDLNRDPHELTNLAFDPSYQPLLSTYRNRTIDELRRTDGALVNHLPPIRTSLRPAGN